MMIEVSPLDAACMSNTIRGEKLLQSIAVQWITYTVARPPDNTALTTGNPSRPTVTEAPSPALFEPSITTGVP